jgi:hypothetical protein
MILHRVFTTIGILCTVSCISHSGQRGRDGLGDILPTLIAVAQSAASQTNQ